MPLSRALKMIALLALVLIAPDSPLVDFPADRQRWQPAAQPSCETDPAPGYAESIRGLVDGDVLEIEVSSRFGGAVQSLTWRGVEFINIYDHGRQISYAWSLDGYGECLNPTEPGSARDFQALTSTSELLSVCTEGENKLTSVTQPAFWLAPGESGFCGGGVTSAVNEALVSDQTLTKTMEIGYRGLENVIAFTAQVEVHEDHELMQLEIPTGYLTYAFSDYWVFNPATGELARPEPQDLAEPWSFVHTGSLPPILSTPDGQYAMGAYSAEKVLYYSILHSDGPPRANETNKWNIVVREEPAPAGIYTYRSFAIVGTLEAVQQAMRELYELHPTDLAPPTGYVDQATCRGIDGWAWDPKAPNQPIEVEVYRQLDDGSRALLGRTTADAYRVDLEEALGDDGRHGFHFDPLSILPDSSPHTLRIFAVNSEARLQNVELFGSGIELQCAGVVPTGTPASLASPTATAAAQQTQPPTAEPNGPLANLPCPGLALPLSLALLGGRRSLLSRASSWFFSL